MSATHHRRTIREAVCAGLAAAGTAAGTRVYDHPTDDRTTFPALTVEDDGEDQEGITMPAGAGRVIKRRYRFTVGCEVQQIKTFARARDDLCAEVEAYMAGAAITGVKSIAPVGYSTEIYAAAERPIAVGRQQFEALYFTAAGTPGTPL